MILDFNICNQSGTLYVIMIAKYLINVLKILAPIIIIYSGIKELTKSVISGEPPSKHVPLLVKKLIAALLIFFVPTIVNYAINSLASTKPSSMMATCSKNANITYIKSLKAKEEKERLERMAQKQKEAEEAAKKANQKISADNASTNGNEFYRKRIEAARRQARGASIKIKDGEMFTEQTKRIIEQRANELNYNNFNQVISSYGGFQGYVNSLGGVFKELYGKELNVQCASELQEVSEYVFGFMTLYGFDYYNGNKYCKWGGNCDSPNTDSADAFYPSGMQHTQDGLNDKSHFDRIVSGAGGINMTTNCNWTVDMVYYKAGLFGTGRSKVDYASSFRAMGKKGKIITNLHDVQVGDLIHFFASPITVTDPNTWDNWRHVAYVGEVDRVNNTFTVYDGGSYFTNNKSFKYKHSMDDKGSIHGFKSWVIVRVVDIDQTC
jgi:hypothetical protein